MLAETFDDNSYQEDLIQENTMALAEFIAQFGDDLMASVQRHNTPVYDGTPDERRASIMNGLLRKPFEKQADAVQALSSLLFDAGEQAAILNAEMGTGKTMMAICLAAIARQEGCKHTMVISPPHLVYKWRREILETIPGAKVWVLNGPDTLAKMLKLRELLGISPSEVPEFFVIGRVRMRLGYHWRHAFALRKFRRIAFENQTEQKNAIAIGTLHPACPKCGEFCRDDDGELLDVSTAQADTRKRYCKSCNEPLWTLMRPKRSTASMDDQVCKSLCQLPTIGPKTAQRLVKIFGAEMLQGMLADNIYEFVNLMDEEGDFVFSDRQAHRIERALGKIEFGFGQGGYQPTEFAKRYLPKGFLDLLIVDEGHEYKNEGSAQGQAMGTLASIAKKTLLLTGTLMGGYATDLFFLLWRIMPARMLELGYTCSNGSMASASLAFMRDHGVLKEIRKVRDGGNHATSRGKRVAISTAKGPGFGPLGIAQCVLPFTVFLKLKDIGQDVLPPYDEFFEQVEMTHAQRSTYKSLEDRLTREMKEALRAGDNSLTGVVLNSLLAWPDTCFRKEIVKHPRSRDVIAMAGEMFVDDPTPKEHELIEFCKSERAQGRRVLVYTAYTGKRDTTSRLKTLLERAGMKFAVLRASVPTEKREDWIDDQVDKGVDGIITNPELVKTGLDMLAFPSIVFMQTGYNVYTLMQAARRSWRIGQTLAVKVLFFGYEESAQARCLSLMAEKIAVTQSTSGDIPDSGLDSLNHRGDSLEVSLARDLVA